MQGKPCKHLKKSEKNSIIIMYVTGMPETGFFRIGLLLSLYQKGTKRYADGKKFSQPCKTAFGDAV